jgi:hypothetical protein
VNHILAVFEISTIALYHGSLYAVFLFDLFRKFLCRLRAGIVIYGNIAAFRSELFANEGS